MSVLASSEPRQVREVRSDEPVAHLSHPEWTAWPWLVQGITLRGGEPDGSDFGLFTEESPAEARARWERLIVGSGMVSAVCSHQIHGNVVRAHGAVPPGLHAAAPGDGHLTRSVGTLLGVTVADCVPVWLVHPGARVVGVLHAGWRGIAAGVVEEGLRLLGRGYGIETGGMKVHLGPAICGACYEVGPEVHEALDLPRPVRAQPVDLRAQIAQRVVRAGVLASDVTVSRHCTRCGGSDFFSHRAGDAGRQVAFVGIVD